MPKGQKRKRDEEGSKMPPRKSTRQRKKKSFGEDFQELYSPPKGNGNGGQANPQPGTSTDPVPEPEPVKNSVTWPSEPKYWKQGLPPNHSKRLYLFQNRSEFDRKRSW